MVPGVLLYTFLKCGLLECPNNILTQSFADSQGFIGPPGVAGPPGLEGDKVSDVS